MNNEDTPSEATSTPPSESADLSQDWPELRDLIQQARDGSAEARNELMRSVQSYLLMIANQDLEMDLQAKMGPSDLVQSALILAEQNLKDFRGDTREQLLAWLRQILRNEMATAHRTFIQAAKRDVRREVTTTPDSHTVLPLIDDAPTPGTEAVMHEEAAALRAALGRLPPDYRTVVVFRNWERLSFEEIGQRMERSTDAVKKLWARAIVQLQNELK